MLQSMRIKGGNSLFGEIEISGAKNLALPALVATLLTDEPIKFRNVPNLADIRSLFELLSFLGTDIDKLSENEWELKTNDLKSVIAPYDYVRKMRASILVLGPLLARAGKATVSLPGGCSIGTRGVDIHLEALKKMGASIEIENGYINANAAKGLFGTDIHLEFPTVTGTENILMAATLAKGRTRIYNAAQEPEIVAFVELLNSMGASIKGNGTSTLIVDGADKLHGTDFKIIADRIEAGSYAIASAMTNGELLLKNCVYKDLEYFFECLKQTGILVESRENGVFVKRQSDEINPYDVETAPYPGFPTDLQAQYVALMTIAKGNSCVSENIFENRFMHVPELCRMGASITVKNRTAHICGVEMLKGAPVMATDLRASVALVIAGLVAEGETLVNRIYHLDRGYDNLEEKLRKCGADIERIEQK